MQIKKVIINYKFWTKVVNVLNKNFNYTGVDYERDFFYIKDNQANKDNQASSKPLLNSDLTTTLQNIYKRKYCNNPNIENDFNELACLYSAIYIIEIHSTNINVKSEEVEKSLIYKKATNWLAGYNATLIKPLVY